MPEIKKLKNGITLILAPNSAIATVSLLIMVGIGSRDESEEIAGISHFLEHMFFDGTTKRPKSADISREVDAFGADFNAFTAEEVTGFYITSASEHLKKTVDVFSDMLTNSKFEDNEIKKEKSVIFEEIKMYEDMPGSYVQHIFNQAIYGSNPLGRDVAGTIQAVGEMNREKIINFKNSYYFGENVVIVISGNFSDFSSDDLEKIIGESFNFPQSGKIKNRSNKFSQEKLKFQVKNTSQTNLLVGFHAPAIFSPDWLATKLLAIILGGNMSSRMFLEIREKQGLAYSVRTSYDGRSDIGDISTSAGVANDKAELALKAILSEYEKIRSDVSVAEVKKAKSYLIGQAKISFEDSRNVAQFLATWQIYSERVITTDDYYRMIQNVKIEDVVAAAKKYLQADKVTVAAIGPKTVISKINNFFSQEK